MWQDNKYKLFAPPEYWALDNVNHALICNGCGAKDNFVLPSKFIEACYIHDYMYFAGKTLEDKETADLIFLDNMKSIAKQISRCLLLIAYIYYFCVKHFGWRAFFVGK